MISDFNLINLEKNNFFLQEKKYLKILYIDGLEKTKNNYLTYLKNSYLEVHEAYTIKKAFEKYNRYKPDIIILDINLPDGSGLSFLRQIRQNDIYTKVIVLTTINDIKSILEATELKLTKYLLKPVLIELLEESLDLAIDEISRYEIKNRISFRQKINNIYSFDMRNCYLYDNNSIIDITPKQKKILHHLIINKNRVCTYDDLSIAISEYYEDITSKNSLKTLIGNLRKKLTINFIENIHSTGYRINLTQWESCSH